jgi:hypothetical protein
MNRLRSLLHDYYPQALQAFPNLSHRAAATVLLAAPTPQDAARLTSRRVVSLLRQAGRRNDAGLAEQIVATLRAGALRQPAHVEQALGVAAVGLINIITAMSDAIDALEAELASLFDEHSLAAVITSLPGLGPILGARVLGELGDDPHRFVDPQALRSFAGTAPITRASGRARAVSSRRVCNRRLANACHWWAFAALTKIRWRQSPLRPSTSHRRHPQRGTTQPREQAPRQAVVLPAEQHSVRRIPCLDHTPRRRRKRRRLTADPRGVSTCPCRPGSVTPRSSSTRSPESSSAGPAR